MLIEGSFAYIGKTSSGLVYPNFSINKSAVFEIFSYGLGILLAKSLVSPQYFSPLYISSLVIPKLSWTNFLFDLQEINV